jgi:N-acyl homoserine lactone hydrolase
MYKNARFIIQKKEIEYARNPHTVDAYLFEKKENFEDLKLEIIDGEKEIIPGVTVFLSPGHTPGGQSVEINTPAGKAVITGFCSCLSNFIQTEPMKRMGLEVCVPSIHTDIRQAYDSILEIKRRAKMILPLHDPSFADKERIP